MPLLVATVVSLAGCDRSAKSGTGAFVVGITNVNDIYDYTVRFRNYLVEAAAERGINVIVMNAAGDTSVQNGQIDDMIVRGVRVVSAIPIDMDGSIPGLEAARAAKLPYVSFLTSVRDGEKYPGFIYVGSRNYDAGWKQGEYLAEILPQDANIIYFTMHPNDIQAIDRRTGFMDSMAKRPDVTFVVELNVQGRRDLAINATEDVIQSVARFDAIVAQNDDAALGVVESLKAAGRLSDVVVVGLDGSPPALESIAAGELTMSVLQNPRAQAQAGADVFARIRNGTDPAAIEDVFVPFEIITMDNVARFME